MEKQFILLGPPGVSVESQAAAIATRWQIPHVSMDELLQAAIASESAIGAEAKEAAAGKQIPDSSAMTLIRRRFEQPDVMLQGWVLDGFPRTLGQAQAFDDWAAAVGLPPFTVVYLKATPGILMNRLSADKEKYPSTTAIRQHLDRHQAEVAPLLDHYRQRSQLKALNGSLPFAEVTQALMRLGYETLEAAPLIQDEAELDALLEKEARLVVDCMASWCGSCKQVTPLIDKLAGEYGDGHSAQADRHVAVMKIDFDINRQITKRFELKGIPAVMFFKDGELVETLVGVKSYPEYSAAAARLLDA